VQADLPGKGNDECDQQGKTCSKHKTAVQLADREPPDKKPGTQVCHQGNDHGNEPFLMFVYVNLADHFKIQIKWYHANRQDQGKCHDNEVDKVDYFSVQISNISAGTGKDKDTGNRGEEGMQ